MLSIINYTGNTQNTAGNESTSPPIVPAASENQNTSS